MFPVPSRRRLLVIGLMVLGGIFPLLLHWFFLGRLPTVTPEEAKGLLAQPETAAVLIDVRDPREYAEKHLEAAQNWPYQEIANLASADEMSPVLKNKHLLCLCDSGILSGLAVAKLKGLGIARVSHVHGGMQEWIASGQQSCPLALGRLALAGGKVEGLPFRESPSLEQWVVVGTGFFIKPLYSILAFLFVVLLWRQQAPELVALRWACLWFFIGENFCTLNYLIYNDRSNLFEFLHSLGMVYCFALAIFALVEGIDHRLIKFSDADARCAAVSLCQRCIKYSDVPCGLERLFLFLIPTLAFLALMPWAAELIPVSYNSKVFGTDYNYTHPVLFQVHETRYLPLVAMVLLTIAWVVLRFKKQERVPWSKVYFAAGAGALGFSFFRLVLFQVYRDNLMWFVAWEELTEFMFMVGMGVVFWAFGRGLVK